MITKEFNLDDEAKNLFKQLGGIDKHLKIRIPSKVKDQLGENLKKEEEQLDNWRIKMGQIAYLISRMFKEYEQGTNQSVNNQAFENLVKLFQSIKPKPPFEDSILIRFRGFSTLSQIPENIDYEVIFADINVNFSIIIQIIKRTGNQFTHLLNQLKQAFTVFSNLGINNLHIMRPTNDEKFIENLRCALEILSQYFSAIKNNRPIVFVHKGKSFSLPIVKNESQKSDPNLTLMAGLNGLKPETTQALIQKVNVMIQKSYASKSTTGYMDVYNAIYSIKSIKAKLIKPPVELSNIRWLMVDSGKEEITREKAQVAKLVMESSGNNPQKTAQILKTVYGNDYDTINSKVLGERLQISSGLLNTIEEKHKDQANNKTLTQAATSVEIEDNKSVKTEVMDNIKSRLDQVKDEVYDNLFVQDDVVSVRSGENETIIGKMHANLLKMVSFYKSRSVTKNKLKAIVRKAAKFDFSDYETLARDFDISLNEAKELVGMLENCFDGDGRFLQGTFKNIIPDFKKHERKIFEFLWHYLKECIHQKDRMVFLNSLQVLIARMQQPKRAIKFLIAEFCRDTDKVNFSDRKNFILCNLLIRRYNKELLDVDITPEDVLRVEEGLDTQIADYATWRINNEQERFFAKFKTIHKELLVALNSRKEDPDMPVRQLFLLERESYIFLSLISGTTAHSVIRSALKEYGNTDAKLYHLRNSRKEVFSIMQNLRVIIRGIGRIGDSDDLILLDTVKQHEEFLFDLDHSPQHKDLVLQIIEWLGVCKQQIMDRR
ncbi:MAG: hypothetical protein HQK77_19740 [Desulfobacterales bacterium]|nr:hypothetical protein [Desulfobacterales bacterium]